LYYITKGFDKLNAAAAKKAYAKADVDYIYARAL